jgi:hypothetical protein
MGILSNEQKKVANKTAQGKFIPYMRFAYTLSQSAAVRDNVGAMFLEEGTGEDKTHVFFRSFRGMPVGYRGVVTTHEPNKNKVIDTKKNPIFRSADQEEAGDLWNSKAVDVFRAGAEEEGLEVKNNVEALFYVTELDGEELEEPMFFIYLFKQSTLDDFTAMDDAVEGTYLDFSGYERPSKNEWFSLRFTVSDEVYEEPADLQEKLGIFYNWK